MLQREEVVVLGQQEQTDKLIEEFGRQILVPGIDEAGQLNISKKKVCIILLHNLCFHSKLFSTEVSSIN